MSLIASASPWTPDDDTSQKKRTPMLRKTVKRPPAPMLSDQGPSSNNEVTYQDVQGLPMQSVGLPNQTEHTSRVNQLIDQMSYVNADNGGNKLADFQPLSPPELQKRAEMQQVGRGAEPPQAAVYNPLQIPPPPIRPNPGASSFLSNTPDLGKVASNYNMIYQPSQLINASIAGSPAQQGSVLTSDNRLMEKINYMIHLLEQQHNEKTSNITEEFVLYTFLGIFIIFIVDSFARAGKYTR
jgi:hypothetical protein